MGQAGCWYGFLDVLTGWMPAKLVGTQIISYLLLYGVLGTYFERKEYRFTRWASQILPASTLEDFHADSWLKLRKVCWAWHGKKVMDELHSSFNLLNVIGLPIGVAAGFIVAAVLSLQGVQAGVCQSGLTSAWLVLVGTYAWIVTCLIWGLSVRYRFNRLVLDVDENL